MLKSVLKTHLLNITKPFYVVSLDATNTLIKMKESPPDVYVRFGEELGISADPAVMPFRFKQLCRQMRSAERCYAHGGGGAEHWWKEVVRGCFFEYSRDPEVIDKLAKNLFDYYATAEPWELLENDIESSLKTIKDHGLKLAITSDFDFRLRTVLDCFKLGSYIDVWALSGEQCATKGHQKFLDDQTLYQRLICLLEEQNSGKCERREIVHIGDDAFEDFMVPRKFGIQCLLCLASYDKELNVMDPTFVSIRNKPPADLITPSISHFVKECILSK